MGTVTDLAAYRAQQAERVETSRVTLACAYFAARNIPLTPQGVRELLSPGTPGDSPDLDPAS